MACPGARFVLLAAMSSLPLPSAIRDSFEADEFLDVSAEQDQNRTQDRPCCCRTAHPNSCLLLENSEAKENSPVHYPGSAYLRDPPSTRPTYTCPDEHGFYPPIHFNIKGTIKNCGAKGKTTKSKPDGKEVLVRMFFVNHGWTCRDALEDMTTVITSSAALIASKNAPFYVDPPLADLAIQRAELFGRHMKKKIKDFWGADKISAVFSSSEVSAMETALHTFEGEYVHPIPFISEPLAYPRRWEEQKQYVEKPFNKHWHTLKGQKAQRQAAQKLVKRVKFDVGPETQAPLARAGPTHPSNIYKKHDYEAFLKFMPAALEEVVQWKGKRPLSMGTTEIAVVVVAGPQFIQKATQAASLPKKNEVFAKQYKLNWGGAFARLDPTALPSTQLWMQEDAFPEYPDSVTELCQYDVERCDNQDKDQNWVKPEAWLSSSEAECAELQEIAESRVDHDRHINQPYLKIWEEAASLATASGYGYTPVQASPVKQKIGVHEQKVTRQGGELADRAEETTGLMPGAKDDVPQVPPKVTLPAAGPNSAPVQGQIDVRYEVGDDVVFYPRSTLEDQEERTWYGGAIVKVGYQNRRVLVLVEYQTRTGTTRKEWTRQEAVISKALDPVVRGWCRVGGRVKVKRNSGVWEDAKLTEVDGEWVMAELQSDSGRKMIEIQDISRLAPGTNPYRVDDEVEVWSNSQKRWFRGQIVKVAGDNIWAAYPVDEEFPQNLQGHPLNKPGVLYYDKNIRQGKGPRQFLDGQLAQDAEESRERESLRLNHNVPEAVTESHRKIMKKIQERAQQDKLEKEERQKLQAKEDLQQKLDDLDERLAPYKKNRPAGWTAFFDHQGEVMYGNPISGRKQSNKPESPAVLPAASGGGPGKGAKGFKHARLDEESVDEEDTSEDEDSQHSVTGEKYKRFK